MNINLYDKGFFAWHKQHVHNDCVEAGIFIAEYFSPQSVIDYGCGIGSFLQGIKGYDSSIDVKGYEISKHAKEFIDSSIIDKVEFKNILKVKDFADISLCLEVAEHIDPENSEQLVKVLCTNTKDYIIFTAAPEGQHGTGHINCQSKTYWIDLFESKGWALNIAATSHLIDNVKLADYYINNLMIFTN